MPDAAHVAPASRNLWWLSFIDPDLIGKWMGLLQQVKPDTVRVAIVFNRKSMSVYDGFVGTLAGQRRTGVPELVALAYSTIDSPQHVSRTLVLALGVLVLLSASLVAGAARELAR